MVDEVSMLTPATVGAPVSLEELLDQYGCGPVRFSGHSDALYERHLLFDDVIDQGAATGRDRFEAAARSIRDVLSQRWLRTEHVYDRVSPKRIYYLSMEFLIGRSLSNNVNNLRLDRFVQRAVQQKGLDWPHLLEREPDAGLGNGGLGRLAACFLDSMATMRLPAMGYGLRYEYGMFKQTIEDGWQRERPDHWLRRHDPWEVLRPHETVEVVEEAVHRRVKLGVADVRSQFADRLEVFDRGLTRVEAAVQVSPKANVLGASSTVGFSTMSASFLRSSMT